METDEQSIEDSGSRHQSSDSVEPPKEKAKVEVMTINILEHDAGPPSSKSVSSATDKEEEQEASFPETQGSNEQKTESSVMHESAIGLTRSEVLETLVLDRHKNIASDVLDKNQVKKDKIAKKPTMVEEVDSV